MKRQINIFILLLLIVFISCKDYKKPIVINKEDLTLILPGILSEDKLDTASYLEYANRYRNFYFVCFKKNITNSKKYLDSIEIRRLEKNLDSSIVNTSKYSQNEIDSVEMTIVEGNYPEEKEKLYYYYYSIENKNNLYQFVFWTRGFERFLKYKKETLNIINSIKFS